MTANTTVISCRIDPKTMAILESMGADLGYPKSTTAGLALRFATRWLRQQMIEAAKNGGSTELAERLAVEARGGGDAT